MSSFRQACPACARQLELPHDAVGRLGKCPACEATFKIGEIIDATAVQVADASDNPAIPEDTRPQSQPPTSVYQTPDSLDLMDGNPQSPDASSPESLADWQNASQHPFSVPLGAGTTEAVPDAAYIAASQPIPKPSASISGAPSGPITIEGIITPTFSIFGERWPPLVISLLIVVAVIAFLVTVPVMVISGIADAGGNVAALVLTLICTPLVVTVICGACVGIARVTIATAGNTSPSPMSHLVSPLSLVVRFLVSALLLGFVIGAIALAFAALMAMLAAFSGNNQIATVLTVMSTIALALGLLLAIWLFWAWPLIVSDGRETALGSLKSAVALTMRHRLTSALMVLIAIVLTAIGTLMCNVGHIVTGPLTALMFAVGYLQMTGQRVDQPMP
jgi:hypothetical protein